MTGTGGKQHTAETIAYTLVSILLVGGAVFNVTGNAAAAVQAASGFGMGILVILTNITEANK